MAEMEQLVGLAQTEIIVFPIIDVSGSMAGEKIGQVNEAMSAVPQQLADINEDAMDAKLKIAPMEFSSGARWFALKGNAPAEVETFRWIDMKASGLTDLGSAFKLLAEKLTVEKQGGWMKGRGGAAPVIILISDGAPTDDYRKQLDILKKRGWFRAALKFAVAVGADADKSVLAEFTGNSEAVIDTEVIRKDLASIIKTVIRTASQTASQGASQSNNSATKQEVEDISDDANQQAQKEAIENVQKNISMEDAAGDFE